VPLFTFGGLGVGLVILVLVLALAWCFGLDHGHKNLVLFTSLLLPCVRHTRVTYPNI